MVKAQTDKQNRKINLEIGINIWNNLVYDKRRISNQFDFWIMYWSKQLKIKVDYYLRKINATSKTKKSILKS